MVQEKCKSIGCKGTIELAGTTDFCEACERARELAESRHEVDDRALPEKYPEHYRPVGELTEIDVYYVHHLFHLQDPSGCLHQASRTLLLSGSHTGGVPVFKDIERARDILTRWLQINQGNP